MMSDAVRAWRLGFTVVNAPPFANANTEEAGPRDRGRQTPQKRETGHADWPSSKGTADTPSFPNPVTTPVTYSNSASRSRALPGPRSSGRRCTARTVPGRQTISDEQIARPNASGRSEHRAPNQRRRAARGRAKLAARQARSTPPSRPLSGGASARRPPQLSALTRSYPFSVPKWFIKSGSI